MKIVMELREEQGGKEAKLLVNMMADIYQKSAINLDIDAQIVEQKDGFTKLWITGTPRILREYFKENGLHKWQTVSSTEKRGRVHTSGVIVLVYEEDKKPKFKLNKDDVVRKYTRGSGKGGQNRNKRDTAVQLIHAPTGIQVFSQTERTQGGNERISWELMSKKIEKYYSTFNVTNRSISDNKIEHIRTYKDHQNLAIDHRGNRSDLKSFKRGKLTKLWD